jgi:hypothetical protein
VSDNAADVLAAWFERVDPNECMTWKDLAMAMFAPECHGPLANPEFVTNLPGYRSLNEGDPA